MKMDIHIFVTGLIAFGFFIFGLAIGNRCPELEVEPERTCEVVETKIWATQQCLKFQPGCKMNKGPETFAEYKQNKDWVAENCPKNGDDFQSQLSNK